MSLDALQIIRLAIATASFGLVFSLWVLAMLWWTSRRKARQDLLKARLHTGGHPAQQAQVLRLWKDGEEATTVVPVKRRSFASGLNKLCQDAGWNVRIHTVVMGLVGVSTMCFVVTFILTTSLLGAISLAVVVVLGFKGYLSRRIGRRLAQLESQIAEALALAGRSLRAGHPLIAAFNLVAEELPAPVSKIFSEICQLQSMGLSLEDATLQVAADTRSSDMNLFATSVAVQLRSGGNLADMMDRLAYVIRDRIRLKRRVSVLTAQTQFSKRVLIFLPFAMFAILNIIEPNYMAPLYESAMGQGLLCIAVTQMALGIWLMNKLSVLRY